MLRTDTVAGLSTRRLQAELLPRVWGVRAWEEGAVASGGKRPVTASRSPTPVRSFVSDAVLFSFRSFLSLSSSSPLPAAPPSWVVYSRLALTMKQKPVSSITLANASLNDHLSPAGNDEIENQLKRDRMMAKNEIKMLLLGAGESGKVRVLAIPIMPLLRPGTTSQPCSSK